MKDSFVLYNSYKQIFELLTPKQCKDLILAIFELSETGNLADFKPDKTLQVAWSSIAGQMERDSQKYEKKAMAGRRSGEVRQRNGKNEQCSNTVRTDDSVYVYDSVSDSVSVSEYVYDSAKAKSHPSVEDVKKYVEEKKFKNVDPEEFVNYYEGNGWMVGSNPMKNWKAMVTSWEKKKFNTSQSRKSVPPSEYIVQQMNGELPEGKKASQDLIDKVRKMQEDM